ncbi:MAG TPA: hypothetical protein VEZ55_10100 [Chitinophagaceae bacterium]|jgi:membrane protein YqaA with SNARE-associated domain|nr:hypothetical protein [Chitinophagaceae bacterium]
MRRKNIILFVSAVLLLIVSEYVFLGELFERNHTWLLLITACGIAVGIFVIVSIIRKYNT